MKQKSTPYIYTLIFSCFFVSTWAQEIELKLFAKSTQNQGVLDQLNFNTAHKDVSSVNSSLDSVKNQLKKIGFIDVGLDSISFISPHYKAYFKFGQLINQIVLSYNKDEIHLDELKILDFNLVNDKIVFPFNQLSAKMNKLVSYLDRLGQNFSKTSLKDLEFKEDKLFARLEIYRGEKRKINKIIIEGYPEFSKNHLKRFLNLNEGRVFSQNYLNQLSQDLKHLTFVEEFKPPAVLFTKDSTLLYIYLKKANRNQFDGLIGFNSKENGRGINFNGYIDLSLVNLLHSGEALNLHWKNNGQSRQQFDLSIHVPYIFNTKFHTTYKLNIFKQDSAFVNSTSLLKTDYALSKQQSIGVILKSENSSGTSELNDISDYQSFFYGLNYSYVEKYDHPLFKDKFIIDISALTGERKADETLNQQILSLDAHYLWKLKKQHHIYIANHSRVLLSDKYIKNELFRTGGANSIRGFNENQFNSTNYSFFNVEYRFNVNPVNYFYSITDFGNIKNETSRSNQNVYGFGLGYAFFNKLGLIDLSYAIGGLSKQPLNLKDSRFHLKFITFF